MEKHPAFSTVCAHLLQSLLARHFLWGEKEKAPYFRQLASGYLTRKTETDANV